MADPLRNNGAPPFPPSYLQAFKSASPMLNSFRLDEGYSEDTRSQAGSEMRADSRMGDMMDHEPVQSLLPDWVINMNEGERSEFAYAILRSLRTSSIAAIVDRLNPLLHIDPVLYLPPEITFDIFSYLDPQTLLTTSTLSKSWRGRTLDSRLWRNLFGSEGWAADIKQVKQFEEEQQAHLRRSTERKSRARPSEAVSDVESKSPKKRVRERQLFGAGEEPSKRNSGGYSPLQWAAQHDAIEADEDERMDDAPTKLEGATVKMEDAGMGDISHSLTPPLEVDLSPTKASLDPPIPPSLLMNGRKNPIINWQYLYKQKRRLEANWIAGKYRNFQLPHPNHPEEAHAECVYTIQYSTSHLVSGSRDKTLRIWNLNTQRLAVPPLRGHSASVLCLQFDDRPEQDIVISGGSDCQVILWRFSTGQMIRRLEAAHGESVLNLRFDDRYLITCSKDKTIKIWNRKALLPSDDAYPTRGASASAKFPSYIVNIDNVLQTELASMKPLKEYSLLMTLEGHGAAVNAIQVLDSQIVSASGDRQVKVWDVKTGQCLKTVAGHQKGIACVQFDGRRIVSGSSDETVRIFDRVTGAEVACLKGHNNLVRTVQARFGDLPGSQADEEEQAREVDRKYLTAKYSGALNGRELTREQRRARNAGGRDPKDIFAVGAKLPPGGGGSKWARIVSGSYDETVIIWKRGADGKWTPAHQLYQWEAVVRAGGQPRLTPVQHHHHHPGHGNHPGAHPAAVALPHVNGQPVNVPLPWPANATSQQAQAVMNTAYFQQWFAQFGHPLNPAQLQQIHAQIAHSLQAMNQHNAQANNQGTQSSTATNNGSAATATTTTTASSSSTATQTNAAQLPTQQGQQQPPSIPLPQQATQIGPTVPQQWLNNLPHHPHAVQPGQAGHIGNQPPQAQAQGANAPAQGQAQHHPHHPNWHGNHPLANSTNTNGTNSRVFKLQFDSRRVICCSQDPTIVGWDFANGDKEIEEACRFFGEDY